ncbi:MAG: hypothetical protein JO038_09940 [Alphaproteobacteria bacterium]|nr:hypothetical protein [Alphaproteobacteria bacterium]
MSKKSLAEGPQRTLLFCTSFALCGDIWTGRYRRWLEGIRRGGLEYDQILLVDDCSPVAPPNWSGLVIVPADGAPAPHADLVMARFDTHLGKREGGGYSTSLGWFRSFGYAAEYARAGGFDRIVHIESDTFVLSRRLEIFLNRVGAGWTALWCPRHGFPEDNIQVIAGRSIDDCLAFFGRPYADFSAAEIEKQYPFTDIGIEFVGDRYGEYRLDVPVNADFVAQALDYPEIPEQYFWWLPRHSLAAPKRPPLRSRRSSEHDVACAYNLFLSRNPESPHTVQEKVGATIIEMIGVLIASREFRQDVLPKILNGWGFDYRGSNRLDTLKDWLLRVLSWSPEAGAAIVAAGTTASLVCEILKHPEVVPHWATPALAPSGGYRQTA